MDRRRASRAALLVVLAATFVVGSARPAAACSCATLDTSESFDNADVVFTGDLLEVRTPSGDTYSSADPARFVFAGDRVYKGDARAQQSVVTPSGGSSCGLELAAPGPFLVFATTTSVFDLEGEEGELHSHLCTGSRSIAEVGVPVAFGPGEPALAGASAIGSPDDGSRPIVLVALGAALVLALVGGTVLVRRRHA